MFESQYLPDPPNYGFVNPDFTLPIRTVAPRPIALHDTDWLDGLMAGAAPQITMPDIVRVHWGAGDADIVGRMYRVLAGQESGLVGVSPELVRHYFNQWGYPEDPSAITADEIQAKLDQHALTPNPLTPLLSAQQPMGGF